MATKNLSMFLICSILGVAPVMADHDAWRRAMTDAQSAREAGRIHEAARSYEEAILATEDNAGLSLERATAIAQRASVLHDVQQKREAEKGYLSALTILREQDNEQSRKQAIAVSISLAALYLEADQLSKASGLNLESMIPLIESRSDLGAAYGIIGSIAFRKQQIARAEELWLRSLAICEAENKRQDAAVVLSNLGMLAWSKGDRRSTESYLRRSVHAFASTIGLDHPLSVKAQSNLGQALTALGQHREATEWLERAHVLALRWFGLENAVTVQLCLDRAGALRRIGRKQEAKALLRQVKELPPAVRLSVPGESTVDVSRLSLR